MASYNVSVNLNQSVTSWIYGCGPAMIRMTSLEFMSYTKIYRLLTLQQQGMWLL